MREGASYHQIITKRFQWHHYRLRRFCNDQSIRKAPDQRKPVHARRLSWSPEKRKYDQEQAQFQPNGSPTSVASSFSFMGAVFSFIFYLKWKFRYEILEKISIGPNCLLRLVRCLVDASECNICHSELGQRWAQDATFEIETFFAGSGTLLSTCPRFGGLACASPCKAVWKGVKNIFFDHLSLLTNQSKTVSYSRLMNDSYCL